MVSKVHVANRRQPPQPPASAEPGRGPPRVTAAGGGSGKVPLGSWGGAREPARVPFSFGTKESLSLRHLSLPGGPRKRGAWGRRPEESLCALGPSGRQSVSRDSRGGSAQSPGQGAANMESGRRVGGGGAEVGAQPPPLPLRAEFGAQSRARRLGLPRAPKSQPASSGGGRGWEPNFFLPRDRHVSFLSSRAPAPPGLRARGVTEAPSLTRAGGAEGCKRPERRPIPRRPGSHVLRLRSGPRGRLRALCELLGMQRERSPGGVSGRAVGVVRKFVREWLQVGAVQCVAGCSEWCVERVLPQAS